MTAIHHATSLKAATGIKRNGELEQWLKTNGVKYFYGKQGPFTTQEALNEALGVRAPPLNEEKAEDFDII